MFKTVNFNIYAENLEELIFNEKKLQNRIESNSQKNLLEKSLKPIPKPVPEFWNSSLKYRTASRKKS